MGDQDNFPTKLTTEEATAGFRLRWITNDRRGRADQPLLLQAVVYVFRKHFRLVKCPELRHECIFYKLDIFGVHDPKEGWWAPDPTVPPAWHQVFYPEELAIGDPIQVTEAIADWIDQHPAQIEFSPRDASELPLVE